MYEDQDEKQCAILLAMGGPGNTDEVREYLYNIFSDHSLIQLPGGRLFQKLFAKMISRLRTKKVKVSGADKFMEMMSTHPNMVKRVQALSKLN